MIARIIYDMTKLFSENEEVNRVIYVRFLEALRKKSVDGLCDCITFETIDGKSNSMQSDEVEKRLRELGIYQLVAASIDGIPTPFYEALDALLLGSFGYAEVENEIRKRAVEAVDKGCMEPLMREIDMEWRNGECALTREEVIAKLKEKGIWQLAASEISKQKKK